MIGGPTAAERLESEREYLASLPPLPEAAQIAAMFADGFQVLADLHERCEALVLLYEEGVLVDEARAALDLARDVAELVAAAASQHVCRGRRRVFHSMRDVVEAIVASEDLLATVRPDEWRHVSEVAS